MRDSPADGVPFKLQTDIFGMHARGNSASSIIAIDKYKLAYVPIPKNACSAVKILFFSLQHGKEFGEHFDNVHSKFDYKASNFDRFAEDESYFKFMIVRDPIERFVSAYNNRVKYYREVSLEWFQRHGHNADQLDRKFRAKSLKFDPDINEFALRILDYKDISTRIQHHFVPQYLFFHGRTDAFDKIYNVTELDQMIKDLEERVGAPLKLRKVQETQGLEDMAHVSDLSAAAVEELKRFYRKDYVILKDYI